uniref:Uncharacterized protein n=1 Tax=Rhizophora mucronata TaxID=61149 RepID=A0A2P2KAN3_RHIMU
MDVNTECMLYLFNIVQVNKSKKKKKSRFQSFPNMDCLYSPTMPQARVFITCSTKSSSIT